MVNKYWQTKWNAEKDPLCAFIFKETILIKANMMLLDAQCNGITDYIFLCVLVLIAE